MFTDYDEYLALCFLHSITQEDRPVCDLRNCRTCHNQNATHDPNYSFFKSSFWVDYWKTGKMHQIISNYFLENSYYLYSSQQNGDALI